MKLRNAELLLDSCRGNKTLYERVLRQLQLELMLYGVVIGTAPANFSAQRACELCNQSLKSKQLVVEVEKFWNFEDLSSQAVLVFSREGHSRRVTFTREPAHQGIQCLMIEVDQLIIRVEIELNELQEWLAIRSVAVKQDPSKNSENE